MEIEEMKALWVGMSAEVEKQKNLTGALIIGMTQLKYKSKLNGIFIPEVLSALLSCAICVWTLSNLQRFGTWYLLVCSLVSVLILAVLPVLSLLALRRMKAIDIAANTVQQTIAAYAKAKLLFVRVQKASFYLGAVLLVTFLPTASELIGDKDPFKKTTIWFVYALLYPVFYFLARWVFRKYMRIATQAETLLKDLAN